MDKKRWDIFCTVIDNFGDIGICWRIICRFCYPDHAAASLGTGNQAIICSCRKAINSSRREWLFAIPTLLSANAKLYSLYLFFFLSYLR
jgi:hypothetical protein